MKTTLLVLAAGMGSRYGGLKQIDSVGPNGESIIDYSMFDAVKAGFEKIVFVIRRSFEDTFKKRVEGKLDGLIETVYAYQELDSCLGNFQLPPEREKPWGTGHAVLVAEDLINEPFAIINADDYYGFDSLKVIQQYLCDGSKINNDHYAMVGYSLCNTLSDNGSVARGLCQVGGQMFLKKVIECVGIEKTDAGPRFFDADVNQLNFTGNEIASMNLWGFHPSIFKHLETQFDEFLRTRGSELKSELFIPSVVDQLINNGQVAAKVLTTDDRWFGITYKEDMPIARQCIKELISRGIYPEKLWAKDEV